MPKRTQPNAKAKGGKPTKRKLQAIETRNRIYAAAVKMMERNGFENITIEQISKAANVSVGAFYHHFGSKNDILDEIFRRADDYFREQVLDKLSGSTAAEKILSYFDHYARFNAQMGVDHLSALYKTQSRFFINSERLMVTALRDVVTQGIRSGELNAELSPEEMTDFLFATARGVAYAWCLHDGRFSLQERMGRYIGCQVKSLVI
ncbi:MAG: TetR/AcrR family transcriptional regulator [Desulfobacteraceae bacterium]|jgi:AcrR family transcriptional regulator